MRALTISDDLTTIDGEDFHVTRSDKGGVFGHSTKHCDEAGCAGGERFLGVLVSEFFETQFAACEASARANGFDGEYEITGDDCLEIASAFRKTFGRMATRDEWEGAGLCWSGEDFGASARELAAGGK